MPGSTQMTCGHTINDLGGCNKEPWWQTWPPRQAQERNLKGQTNKT